MSIAFYLEHLFDFSSVKTYETSEKFTSSKTFKFFKALSIADQK